MNESELKTPLAADVQEMANLLDEAVPGGFASLSVEQLRAFNGQLKAQVPPGPEVASVEDQMIGEGDAAFRVRVYKTAADTPRAALMYIHGGGWTIGDVEGGYDYLCRDIASQLDIVVVSVDYRLAPEHKFPAAVDDVVTALSWLRESAETLGIDTSRIAVAGDSAGGNLTTVLTHLDRDARVPLKAQVLIYPASEYAVERPSWIENAEAPLLGVAEVLWFFEQYLDSPEQAQDPRVSSALNDSFADLPSALVITAGHDPLRDDGRNYASLLERDGVNVRHLHVPDTIHGFISSPTLGSYRTGMAEIIDFLRQELL